MASHKTNLEAVNALCVASGGSGGHYTMIDAVNELCEIQGVTSDNVTVLTGLNLIDAGLGGDGDHVTNLAALNSIDTILGGEGGHNQNLTAWNSIVDFGFSSDAAIIEIINGLTGEEDETYLDAVNSLAVLLGGEGGHSEVIDALNEIGSLVCDDWGTDALTDDESIETDDEELLTDDEGGASYTTNIEALNAIAVCLGGDGGHASELAAWQEIASIGFNAEPTDILLSSNSISEGNAIGDTIGVLSSVDPDTGNTFTYTKVAGTGDTDNDLVTIDGDLLKANAVYDFETKSSLSIRLKSTDQGGKSVEKAVTISVLYNISSDEGFISNLKGLKTVGEFTYLEDIVGTNDAKLVKSLATTFSTAGFVSTTNATIKDNLRHLDGVVTTIKFPKLKCNAVVPAWVDYSYNTLLGAGGYSTAKRGYIVGLAPNPGASANRFKVTVTSDTNIRTMTFATDILLEVHDYDIAIDTTELTVTLFIDGVSVETQNIPAGGTTWETNSVSPVGTMVVGRYGGVLGTSGNCAEVTMPRVIVMRGSTVTFDLPLSQCTKDNIQPYDRVTGIRMTSMSGTTSTLQDYAHVNLGLNFELYDEDGVSVHKYYVPFKTDGTPIAPTITGWSRVHPAGVNNIAGNWHNGCETLVEVSTGVEKTFAELAAVPWVRYFVKTYTGVKLDDIVCYATDKDEDTRNGVLAYLGIEKQKVFIHIGDSIISQSPTDPLIASLPSELASFDYSFAKVFDFASGSIVDLTVNNSDQPHVTGDRFACKLTHAYAYKQANPSATLYLCGHSAGGTTLGGGYTSPNDAYTVMTETSILALFRAIITAGKYPDFEAYVSLGTNDAGLHPYEDDFDINIATLVNRIRAYTAQAVEFHWLRVRADGVVKTKTNSAAAALTAFYIYDANNTIGASNFIDSVHPSVAGVIQMGSKFASKTHE